MQFSITSRVFLTLSVASLLAQGIQALPINTTTDESNCFVSYVYPDGSEAPLGPDIAASSSVTPTAAPTLTSSSIPSSTAPAAAVDTGADFAAVGSSTTPSSSTTTTPTATSESAAAISAAAVTAGESSTKPPSKQAPSSSSTPAPALTQGSTSDEAPSVAASSPAASASASPSSSGQAVAAASTSGGGSGSKKRGLAYNDASLTGGFGGSGSQVSWAYNWASSTSGLSDDYEYVPMLWGTSSDKTSSWSSVASAAIKAGSKHLLAFNEPDNAGQANISPEEAAAGYKQFMQPFAGQAQLGAPAVTNAGSPAGLAWLESFLGLCTDCQIDFVPIHWYDSATNFGYFKEYVESAYKAGGNRPLWITEFGASGSTDEQNTFLQDVMPWLDSLNYVQRYAYFGCFDGNLVDGSSPSLPLGDTFMSYTSATIAHVMD
ncbi:MAG: hypothetical protein M1838_001001 [Thelocarpon superellum]|nr:MAG: hypothetical protein M1838_001001 [Thelocarpon superellum]